jgi:hypothetical protein
MNLVQRGLAMPSTGKPRQREFPVGGFWFVHRVTIMATLSVIGLMPYKTNF